MFTFFYQFSKKSHLLIFNSGKNGKITNVTLLSLYVKLTVLHNLWNKKGALQQQKFVRNYSLIFYFPKGFFPSSISFLDSSGDFFLICQSSSNSWSNQSRKLIYKISPCHFHLARNKDRIKKGGGEWLFIINFKCLDKKLTLRQLWLYYRICAMELSDVSAASFVMQLVHILRH